MTGRRLLIQILGYEYSDCKAGARRKNKKWSKLGRLYLKRQLKQRLNDKN